MEKIILTDKETTTDNLTSLVGDLSGWLAGTIVEKKPEILIEKVEKKPEIFVEKVEKEMPPEKIDEKIEGKDVDSSKILQSETYYSPKLEEWRSKIIERLIGRGKIIERLDILNTQKGEIQTTRQTKREKLKETL